MEELSEYYPMFIEVGMQLIAAILVLIIGFWLAKRLKRLTLTAMEKRGSFDETVTLFVANVVHASIAAFTIVITLTQVGVETSSLIAILGAMGLAIGLALQGTLSNVSAGVMLLILRPIRVGEFIEAAGEGGTVKEVGIFHSRLQRPDGVIMVVPNNAIWSSTIVNYSINDLRRVDIVFGISYDDSHEDAIKLISDLLAKDERVLKDPEPQVFVSSLGESSVDITMRAWVANSDYWQALWDITGAGRTAIEEAGISIPYPHRQLIISKDSESA